MNRRDFMIVGAGGVSIALLPRWVRADNSTSNRTAIREGSRKVMLHGIAGKGCAQHPSQIPLNTHLPIY